ncbi:MAG: quinone-dependent dihydroorotate dehydrogenase [Alphaproteobacteria bacterium]|nr:quinone-dependent dihydroorotate dehydrogenase [Alphaproteobacteria bacterium]
MKLIPTLANLAQPVLARLDPELAHTLTIRALSVFHNFTAGRPDDPRLQIETLGMTFPNPIGLAAGFDKNAQVTQAMLALGFGFVEAGTVTPQPQSGNPKPRIFRLHEDRAVINRLGFNNEGLEAARKRLNSLQGKAGIRGINIGANKDTADRIADYVMGLNELGPLASYVTINISSPNTPGLRGLQNKSELDALLTALIAARKKLQRRPPLLVKIAPDLDDHACADIAAAALSHGIEGLIVSNTTLARPASLKSVHAGKTGGLSGQPLFTPSTDRLRTMRRLTQGKLTLIGVGGIASAADAYAKIKAGASLVQLYTALTFEGPNLITRLKRELLTLLDRDGFKSISEAIGQEAN